MKMETNKFETSMRIKRRYNYDTYNNNTYTRYIKKYYVN